MAIRIINVLEKFDKKTNQNLSKQFIQEVFKIKKYTLTEYITYIYDVLIPAWSTSNAFNIKDIHTLKCELKKELSFIL